MVAECLLQSLTHRFGLSDISSERQRAFARDDAAASSRSRVRSVLPSSTSSSRSPSFWPSATTERFDVEPIGLVVARHDEGHRRHGVTREVCAQWRIRRSSGSTADILPEQRASWIFQAGRAPRRLLTETRRHLAIPDRIIRARSQVSEEIAQIARKEAMSAFSHPFVWH
jgi:hypothetical protein